MYAPLFGQSADVLQSGAPGGAAPGQTFGRPALPWPPEPSFAPPAPPPGRAPPAELPPPPLAFEPPPEPMFVELSAELLPHPTRMTTIEPQSAVMEL